MSDLPPGPMPPPEPAAPRPSVGIAISWAFDQFKRNAAAFVGLAAVVTILQFLQQVGTRPLENIITDCSDPQTQGQINACAAAVGASFLVTIGITLVFTVLAVFATIGVQRAAIRSTQGISPSFAQMLTTQNLGKYVLFVLLYTVLFIVGLVLCFLPGIAVVFLLQLAPYYILDRGMGPIEAIKASFRAVTRNFGPAVLMALFNVIVLLLGGVFYGILTLVTLPFACLFTAHMYRQFNGEPVA